MKNPQIFNNLAKNRGTKALALFAVVLLTMQPYALAMDQIVNKYPSGATVAAQDIGNAHPLDVGSVFNFNNAKAPSVICLKPAEPGYPQAGCTDNLSLSEVDENNCDPESTEFTFDSGSDGWEGTVGNANLKYLYDGTNYAIEANLTKKNQTALFTYEKKFFYECGTPGMSDFKIRYRLRSATGMNTTAGTNYIKVELIKPLAGVISLVAQTNLTAGDVATGWIWKPGPADTNTLTIPTTNWNESGVYTIRISGQLRTTNTGTGHLVAVQFDDIDLRKTSLWTDYRHDVEYFVKAAPYSQLGGAGNGYILEIKAAKKSSAADNANVLVYNGASWINKGAISQAYNETLPQNNLQVLSIPLSDAEYNNGLVRVRYVDATQTGDLTPGGVYIDYQRVKVDQGICVQEVRAIEADCGKCHNYNGDVTKPWPSQGMHNKHAQTESVSDCAWCHPDVTVGGTVFPSDHMNGVQAGRAIEVAGTKIFRTGGVNPQGAVGSWDPATGQCTLSDCHNGLTTPAWTATYGATNGELNGTTIIARNCSRCHNTGVNNSAPAAADVNNLNIAAAWPDTLAHREHDNAFNMDENSCQANGSCHPDNRVQHTPVKDADGVATLMSPKYQSPSGSGVKYIKATTAVGDGRCYNATCHGGQETPKWNAAVGSLDPSQPNSAYCKACHKGEKASTWTPGAILPDISAKQYNSPISGLHQGSPPTSGKSHVSEYGCAVCHTTNPTLHFKDGTGSTNLDSWQMDPITSSELVTTMGYASGTGTPPSFTDGTPPTCATPYPGPGGLTCHAETDTASAIGKLATTNTPWERDWSWDAYSSTAADRCKVCHGVYGSFKTLRPAHTSPKLAGNHSDNGLDCATTCHAQTDNETIITTNIYNHGVSLTADAKTIDVNMNVGFTQSTAMETALTTAGLYAQQYVMQTGTTSTVGCTGCHVSTGSFAMQESGWKLRNQITGPGVTCDNDATGCHGNNTANQIWPDGTGGAVYPDRVGKHQQHMTKLAAKLNITLASATEAQQKQMCTYCHGLLATIGASGHTSNGTANQAEASGFLHINAVADAGTAATYSNDANATCSGIDCHNNQATTATYNWRTGAASTCTMCHTPGGSNTADPTSGLHNNTLGLKKHDSTINGSGCGACHTMPAISNLAGATHINGTFTANNASNNSLGVDRGIPTTMYSEITPASGRSGSCSGSSLASCHTDTGKWSRLWSTEANSALTAPRSARCNVCHGQWSTIAGSTGWAVGTSHYKAGGTNAATNARGKIHEPVSESCDNCHAYGASGAARHNITATPRINVNNNGLTPARTSNVYDSGTAGCTGTGTCHSGAADATHNFPISQFTSTYVAAGTAFPQPTVNCGTCHTGGVTRTGQSGAHAAHGATSGLLTTNPASVALCIECHGHNGSGAHSGNGIQFATVTVTGTGLASTCTNTTSCHNRGAEPSPAWSATQLDCNDCHYYPGALSSASPGTKAANDAHARPLTLSHSDHIDKGKLCSHCHGTMPADGTTTHATNVSGTNADKSTALQAEATVLATVSATYGANTTYTWNNTANTCTPVANNGLGCHATATPTWGTPIDITTACTACHTNTTTAAVNPTTGLHNGTMTTSANTHDDNFQVTKGGASTGTCVTCHTTQPTITATNHMNGTFSSSPTAVASIINFNTSLYFTDSTTAPTCGPKIGAGYINCHSDDGVWKRKWSVTAKDAGTTRCANCHGDFTAGFTTGVGARHQTTTTGDADGEIATSHGAPDQCYTCHAYKAGDNTYYNFTTQHNDNTIQVVTTSFVDNGTTVGCASACHVGTGGIVDEGHEFTEVSGTTPKFSRTLIAGPAAGCTSCHTGSGGGAKNVGPASPHVKVTVAGSFGACTNCHNNHTGAAVGGIIIPNNASVGINYSTTGHTGIQLGGTGTDASISALTNEAAMCWACHALPANLISEWGANTDPSTGNSTYNYGSVTTPDWTTATWSSSRPTQFAYKTAAIQSTHTANPTVTDAALGGAAYTRTETKNTAAQIRCSNCHDVHELGLAPGDKKEGAPYLRGSWMGNPYEEDGAPRSVYANTTYFPNIVFPTRTYGWGAVPRGSNLQGRLGGYWIDQNNVTPMTATTTANGTAKLNPTATWEPLDTNAEAGNSGATSPAFAGLCMLCHDNAGATTALKIDALDKVPSEAIWLGTNGHANSVKGGTGATSASSFNVFDARTGVTTYGDVPRQHYNGMVEPGNNGTYGFRATEGLSYAPLLSSARGYGYAQDTWVVDETGATKESQYHKFSCSKCHNPHASRLPKLMITNCLDTVHNTWDNQFQLSATTGNNLNKEVAQWTSAQNCHRYSQNNNATTTSPEYRASRTAGAAGTGAGWNKVTPWMQTTTTP